MGQELEAKIRVPSHAPIRENLRSAGATPEGITHEINRFFDTPTRSLQAAGKGLRLRSNQRSDATSHVVTFKGPKQASKFKQREEIEFTVDDPSAAQAVLEHLGYAPLLTFEKRRESWTWRSCKIELDTLDGIGAFVEVEAPTDADVTAGLKIMGLDNAPQEPQSYAQMVAAQRK
jgi:adenylate cyclase class 2